MRHRAAVFVGVVVLVGLVALGGYLLADRVVSSGNGGRSFVKACHGNSCRTVPVTTTAATTTITGSQMEPAAIVGQGYSLVFDDEFDSMSYNNSGSIVDAVTWQRPFNGANTDGSVGVSGGVLTMSYTGGVSGKPMLLATRKSSGNFGGSFAPPVYFEASLKLPLEIGAYPQWWTASVYQAWGLDCTAQTFNGTTFNPTLNPELDIIEGGYGQGVGGWTGGPIYNDTVHTNTPGGSGGGNTCGVGDSNTTGPNIAQTGLEMVFHTYSCLWDGTGITFYRDGVATHAKNTIDALQAQPLFLVLGLAAHSNYTGSLPASVSMAVDWVRVWQK